MKFLKNISNRCNCRHENGTALPTWRTAGFLLCALISVSLAACSSQGTQNLSEDAPKTQDAPENSSKADPDGNSSSKTESEEGDSKPQENDDGSSETESAQGGSKPQENGDGSSETESAQGGSKPQENGDGSFETESAQGGEKAENKEPVLEAGASDEELLEVLKDDIHVVSDTEFHDTATGILERTAEYTGKIYQLEGVLKMDGTALCLAHDAEDDSPLLPLKYLKSNFKEGDKVRITGIANQDKESDSAAVLEVIVAEAL